MSGLRGRLIAAPLLLLLLLLPAGGASVAAATQPPIGGESEDQPRRDPFQPPASLPEAPRPSGLAGVRIREAEVRGVARVPSVPDGSADLAILETPDSDGFIVRRGAELMDGVVFRVEPDGVAFLTASDPETEVFRPLAPPDSRAGERR